MMEAGKRCALLLGGALLLAACARESEPAAVPPPPPPEPVPYLYVPASSSGRSAGPRCTENFKLFDENQDGKVTKAEFMRYRHWRADPEQVFTARDQDGDGALTEAEFCSGPRGGRSVEPPPP